MPVNFLPEGGAGSGLPYARVRLKDLKIGRILALGWLGVEMPPFYVLLTVLGLAALAGLAIGIALWVR